MSHTVNVKTTTTNNRRGRGRGQGNQRIRTNTSNNSNYHNSQPNTFRVDYNSETFGHDIQHRDEGWKYSNARGNRKSNRGGGNLKNNDNFKRGAPRSLSSSSSSSSRNETGGRIFAENYLQVQAGSVPGPDSSRLPKHSKNPIFVGELQHRFNSMLPNSELLAPVEAPVQPRMPPNRDNYEPLVQQRVVDNQNVDSSGFTFASISNNVSHGFRNRLIRNQSPESGINANCTGYHRSRSHERSNQSNISSSTQFLRNGQESGLRFTTDGNGGPQSRYSGDSNNKSQSRSFAENGSRYSAENDSRFSTGDNRIGHLNSGGDKRFQQFTTNDNGKSQSRISADNNNMPQPRDFTDNGSRYPAKNDSRFSAGNNKKSQPNSVGGDRKIQKKQSHVDLDRRNQILMDHGFNGRPINQENNNDSIQRNSQRLGSTNSTVGANFVYQMETFDSSKKSANPRNSTGNNSENHSNRQTNSRANVTPANVKNDVPSLDLFRQIDNYNDFVNSQRSTYSQNHNERRQLPAQQELGKGNPLNFNKSNNTASSNGLTRGAVAGAGPFNIQRPVNDHGQAVPSRSEALQRMQEDYELKRVEFEEKQREKEAKKRDQRLAKYQHIDQGHRLNEAYLDEAVGYDYQYFETEEEVRFRQQDQLRRDALAYQEREREENEQQKKREEEKHREWLNKNKHIDPGYKLGHGGIQGHGRGGKQQSKNFKPKNEGKKARENNPSSNRPAPSISPELLLEGESYEEALARQEDQLLVEALILSEQSRLEEERRREQREGIEKESTLKQERERNASSQGQGGVVPRAAGDSGLHQLRKDFREADPVAKGPSDDKLRTHGKMAPPRFQKLRETAKEQKFKQRLEIDDVGKMENDELGAAGNPTAMPQPQSALVGGVENIQDVQGLRDRLLAQLETLVSKSKSSGASSVVQDLSRFSRPIQAEETKPVNSASCTLKSSSQGPVLVLRPSEEALNLALANRPEVQDEMDKYGDTALYKPHVEQAPLYMNHRFEQRSFLETVKVMPKVNPAQSSVLPAPNGNPPVSPSKPTPPEEPVIDHQAEMRAARLRMQQKYEESLRKQQESS